MTQRDNQARRDGQQGQERFDRDDGQGQFGGQSGGSNYPSGQHHQGGYSSGQQGGYQEHAGRALQGSSYDQRGRPQGEQSYQRDYGGGQQHAYGGSQFGGDYGRQQGGGYQGGDFGRAPGSGYGSDRGVYERGYFGGGQSYPQGGRQEYARDYPRPGQFEPVGGYGDTGSSAGYAGPGDGERDYLRHTQGGAQQRGYFSAYQSGGPFGYSGQNEQFDPDYHQWRAEQIRNLDNDYRTWRDDRYKKFSNEFNTWRSQRSSSASAGNTESGTGVTTGSGTTTVNKSK